MTRLRGKCCLNSKGHYTTGPLWGNHQCLCVYPSLLCCRGGFTHALSCWIWVLHFGATCLWLSIPIFFLKTIHWDYSETHLPPSLPLCLSLSRCLSRFDEELGVVYMAARLAGGYTAVRRALNEVTRIISDRWLDKISLQNLFWCQNFCFFCVKILIRDPTFAPHSLLDFGSGLGTVVWWVGIIYIFLHNYIFILRVSHVRPHPNLASSLLS